MSPRPLTTRLIGGALAAAVCLAAAACSSASSSSGSPAASSNPLASGERSGTVVEDDIYLGILSS